MLAVQQRLEDIESEKQIKEESLQALRKEASEFVQQSKELMRLINTLVSEYEPMQVMFGI